MSDSCGRDAERGDHQPQCLNQDSNRTQEA
jgi:hypothetical protein